MKTALGIRLQKAEQAVRLVQTAREWEALTDPATVERQFEEARERIPLCSTPQEVFTVLHSLPTFDQDIMVRCDRELLPLVPDELLLGCIALQEQQGRRFAIREKAKRHLRERGIR
ncbi:MAG: hypothetical protein JWN14_613 [Chthonomonadales bacterium]|nr:hypothetical protein [Chthonomonadales bacterium]